MLYQIAPGIVAFSTERNTPYPQLPYAGFNITPYTGDDYDHVQACRQELIGFLQIPDSQLVVPHQVHGTLCRVVTPQLIDELKDNVMPPSLENVDAVVTDLPNVCVGVSTADCVPILYYDMRTGAVGAVHAGWRGTVAGIAAIVLSQLRDSFGTRLDDVRCIIGPSIGPDAFEVGDEVYQTFFQAGFPMLQIACRKPSLDTLTAESRWYIDLWTANSLQLQQVGVPRQNIYVAGLCTYTEPSRFFSARRLGVKSGRIFSGILRRET